MAENDNREGNTSRSFPSAPSFTPSFCGYDQAPGSDIIVYLRSRQMGRSGIFRDPDKRPLQQAYKKPYRITLPPEDLQFPDFNVIQLHSQTEAIHHGKHTGWCTADQSSSHYQNHYSRGKLYVFYRKVDGKIKRRPSYQLYVSGSHVEFRKKGNARVNPHTFAGEIASKELSNWMRCIMPVRHEFSEISARLNRFTESVMRATEIFSRHASVLNQQMSPLRGSVSEERVLSKKSFKSRTKFDQLIQSKSAMQVNLDFIKR